MFYSKGALSAFEWHYRPQNGACLNINSFFAQSETANEQPRFSGVNLWVRLGEIGGEQVILFYCLFVIEPFKSKTFQIPHKGSEIHLRADSLIEICELFE